LNIEKNNAYIALLDKVKAGLTVHIPQSVFPEEEAPESGYWVGKTCYTKKGGTGDIGIELKEDDGSYIITRPRDEVKQWLV
jgi:hypothetical protein